MRHLVAALLVAGIAFSGTASAQPRRAIELADFYRVQAVSDPQMSPDGRLVAFVRSVIIENDNTRQTEIWLAPANGSSPPTRLTTPSFNATAPRWSPDGALLAFTSRRPIPAASGRPSTTWFLRMDRPSGEAFQIAGVEGTPVFSPDNKWIAYTAETRGTEVGGRPAPGTEIGVRQAGISRQGDGGRGAGGQGGPDGDFEKKLQERFTGRIFDWMNYRFDGRGYLSDPRDPNATPPRDIYVVARDGGTPRRVTSLGVDVQDFAWRPDSQAIAFVANAHQRDEYVYDRADVWTITMADGSQPRRMTDDGFDHDSVAWSPDGTMLYFRRQMGLDKVLAAKQQHGAAVDVFSVAALPDGSGPVASPRLINLTDKWDLLPGRPMVAPDGRVFFSAGIAGNEHLFSVRPTGGAVDQITRGDRQLGAFSASRAFDRWAYTSTDVQHPAEVFAADSASASAGKHTQLSHFNDALISSLDVQPATRILARSKDGTEVEGWLLRPRVTTTDSRPTATDDKWPLILAMHGGPHGAYGNGFAFQFQLWAAHGYSVVYANPRGSTGYGEKFLWGTWGGWGNRDYEDVMAVVDLAITRFPIDERRMGATGYSYGGFLTNWVITQTPRFAAAIVGAGISNWVSDYGTADIPRTKESEFNGPPWEAASMETLMKQSPIVYAKQVTTPTLFVHGEADLRVPIEQAEQMYVALKKRKVPAQFIRYPDMYHGGWTPWNTVHRYHHELQWWGKYLAAKPPTTR